MFSSARRYLISALVSALAVFGGVANGFSSAARGSSARASGYRGSSSAGHLFLGYVAGRSTCGSADTLPMTLARDFPAEGFDRKRRDNPFDESKKKKRVYAALGFMPHSSDANATARYLGVDDACDPAALEAAAPAYDACVAAITDDDKKCCAEGDALAGAGCVRAATLGAKWAATALSVETGARLEISPAGADLVAGMWERFCDANETCEAWEDLAQQTRVDFLQTAAAAKEAYAKECTSAAPAAAAAVATTALFAIACAAASTLFLF